MNEALKSFEAFLALSEQDKRDVFAAAASRLDMLPSYIEKDFWVCLVLEALFNRLPDGHPRLLFKGGTSLSKAFGLIRRFSEDIDLVVYREDLGFAGDRDPTVVVNLSNRERGSLLAEINAACSRYILGDLTTELTALMRQIAEGCRVGPDEDDRERLTLLIEYPALYQTGADAYVAPRVKIEAGARSALDPASDCTITPYVADELPGWSFDVDDIRVIAPERTYWEKLLILHGEYCRHRDTQRLPTDQNRISRHYYDVAMITATETGRAALPNRDLLQAVRNHNIFAFRQPPKKFEEAVPGSVRLVPQAELRTAIERDYAAMKDMIVGEAPQFGWIMEQIQHAEDTINETESEETQQVEETVRGLSEV